MAKIEDKEGNDKAGTSSSLRIGPTRKLLVAEMSLLDRLGLEEQEPMSSRVLVLVLEVLLVSGVGCRLLTMHLAGQLNGIHYYETMTALLYSPSSSFDRKLTEDIKVMHIMTSLVMQVLLVPQLYIIFIITEEKATMMMRSVLVILLLVFTAAAQGLLSSMHLDESCEERNTCLHRNWGWVLFFNIIMFVSIIIVRVLYNSRFKEWILNINVLGPILEFLVSRKCRDYQAQCLLLSLSGATISGLCIHSDEIDSTKVGGAAVVADVVSSLLIMASLMGLLGLYFLDHVSHSHRRVVTQQQLDTELHRLIEDHGQAMKGDRVVSDIKYSPYTRSCDPGTSEQRLYPSQRWVEERYGDM